MKKLINLALTTAMVAGLFGAACADHHGGGPLPGVKAPNSKQAGGTWYYPYIGPASGDYGTPKLGFRYDEDYSGEVVYEDEYTMIVEADGSGDILTFELFPGKTRFDPSSSGVRVGSKVRVNADNGLRAKRVQSVPFYRWLAGRSR